MTINVTRQDLVTTVVSTAATAVGPGGTFTVSDTAQNQGGIASVSSITRFYFSADTFKSAGDRLLTGSRSVTALAPGASSSKSGTKLTVPLTTPLGFYCTDCLRGRHCEKHRDFGGQQLRGRGGAAASGSTRSRYREPFVAAARNRRRQDVCGNCGRDQSRNGKLRVDEDSLLPVSQRHQRCLGCPFQQYDNRDGADAGANNRGDQNADGAGTDT